jgi:hypothetical protein
MTRASAALAALQGEATVKPKHIIQIAHLCVRHRLEANALDGLQPIEAVITVLAREFNMTIPEVLTVLEERHTILMPPPSLLYS